MAAGTQTLPNQEVWPWLGTCAGAWTLHEAQSEFWLLLIVLQPDGNTNVLYLPDSGPRLGVALLPGSSSRSLGGLAVDAQPGAMKWLVIT